MSISGPKLPYKLGYQPLMLSSPNGSGVILIGGWNPNQNKSSNNLLELPNTLATEWTILNQTLQNRKTFPVAFYIPDNLTKCSS